MNNQVGTIECTIKELLVTFEFQRVRHHVPGVRQHSVGGDDDITFNAESRHCVLCEDYSEIVCTTLDTGRELTVGSLASFNTSSSYCGSV